MLTRLGDLLDFGQLFKAFGTSSPGQQQWLWKNEAGGLRRREKAITNFRQFPIFVSSSKEEEEEARERDRRMIIKVNI